MPTLTPVEYFDGDQGPIWAFELRDENGAILDNSSVAVEFRITDEVGTVLGIRPGVRQSPSSSGLIFVYPKGLEMDNAGAGRILICHPKIYMAKALDGVSVATNLLVNSSFDTDTTPANGIADNWTVGGAQAATYAIVNDEPFPAAIFGSCQRIKHAGFADSDTLQQNPAVTINAGDRLSVGVWTRHSGTPGAAKNNSHSLTFRPNGGSNQILQFEVTEKDWYFVTGSVVCASGTSSAFFILETRGTTLENRFDDAFLFMGRWKVTTPDYFEIPLKPRPRPTKASNRVMQGSFERDSDGDGVADGFAKVGSLNTFSLDTDPDTVFDGLASQKVVLANSSGMSLRVLERGKYAVGETWRASVRKINSGTLGTGGGTGGFNIALSTEQFDGAAPQSASTNFGDTDGTYVEYTVDLAITGADRNVLVIDLNLNGKTGTAWFDALTLKRVIP